MSTPIAVTKQDIMRIFDPATNQRMNAWQMDYRRFHDIWVLDNKLDSIYLSIQEAYRLMRDAAAAKEVWDFQEKNKDGTVTEFTAQFSVKRTGGGVNGVIEFDVTMAVQSEIKQTDPA